MMEISKPSRILVRLLTRQQTRYMLYRTEKRKISKFVKAKQLKAKQSHSRVAALTSFAYFAGNSSLSTLPVQKHIAFVPSRLKSSKIPTAKEGQKESSSASAWASVYHAAETVGVSMHKKVMSPLLSYSTHMLPRFSVKNPKNAAKTLYASDHGGKHFTDKRSDEKSVRSSQHLPRATTVENKVEERFDDGKPVEFHSADQEKEPVSFWVQMPSLRKYATTAGLVEMGTSASRFLRRKHKFDKGVSSESGANPDAMIDRGRESRRPDRETFAKSPTSGFLDRVNSESGPAELQQHQEADTATHTYTSSPTAENPSTPPRSNQIMFARLGITSSSPVASSSPTAQCHEKDATSSETLSHHSEEPCTKNDHVSLSHASAIQQEEPVNNTSESKTSYIYNNYNLKYIQVNLFKTPGSLFQLNKKEKIPAQARKVPAIEESSTAYFDSDIPLLELTDAMTSKDISSTSASSSTFGRSGSQTTTEDKTKRYAAVAGKMKEEKAKQKAAKTTKAAVRPVISKSSIDARTKSLSVGIREATSNASRLLKMERLCSHLMQYPESRQVAVQEGLVSALLKLKNGCKDATVVGHAHQLLAHLGYALPVKGRGLRILSIDGGGTRGIIAIEVLRELERQAGLPIHEMFDYFIGVSSGAVLTYLLAYPRASLDTCEQLFKEMSVEVFNRNTLWGTSKLVFNHAFYDTDAWMEILRSHMGGVGQFPAIELAQDPTCPKVAAVATLMNAGAIKNFLFRNYNPPPNTSAFYQGSSKYELSEGLRASSAAPGYFEEYKLDDYVFQDGGVLTNNPTALGLHESRLLWPDTPIQCLVSLGTGRYDPVEEGAEPPEYSSLKKKLYQIMISATDTESVHTTLQDLLPSGSYFRFNPLISEDFLLDENRPEKLDQLQQEALDFVGVNELRIMQAAGVLTREKSRLQKARDWAREMRDIYR